jgi:hypothetical protein
MAALTSEYASLQSARSTTVFESNGRIGVFLSTVSSFVVALAFIGTISKVGMAFYAFALVLLPALFLLGTVTYFRAMQCGAEDLLLSRAMSRIRHYYADIEPAARPYFLLSTSDDAAGHMVNMGINPKQRQMFFTAASMVVMVNSLIAGVFAGVVTLAVSAPTFLSFVVGVPVATLVFVMFARNEASQWRVAEAAVPTMFPSGD